MNNFFRIFIVLIFGLFSMSLFSQAKTIISSEIRWKAYKTLRTESFSHYGTIALKSGDLFFNGDDLAGGSFVFDMNSIDAADLNGDPKMKKMLENHLKSDDFFDTKKFPSATFQITSVKKISNNGDNYQVTGPLTIKGISKNISFPVKVSQDNSVYSLTSAQFTFNRKNYGLQYNIFEDMLISNEVEINVAIKAK